MTRVAFLGLGSMGTPMARRLLLAGLPVSVWNRNPERAAALGAAGAAAAATPRAAAVSADVVATMLADPAAVDAVASGPDGLVAGLAPGSVWLDFSTVAPADSRRYASLAHARDASFCDVPVAGSVEAASDGTLVVFAGGDDGPLEKARPVLDAVARHVERFGPVGQGSAMKLVNNLSFGVALVGFAEALALAERTGIGAERAAGFLLATPLTAPYLKVKYDFVSGPEAPALFSLALAEKDFRLMVETGGRSLPVAEATHATFAAAKAAGFAGADFGHAITFVLGRRPSPE